MIAAIHEARDNLGTLIERAIEGEDVFLSSHGKVLARIVPVPGKRKVTGAEIRAALASVPRVSDLSAKELLNLTREYDSD